jgi:Raf kinase inhibitor-like YbhB/YbcL family protein
MSMTLSSSDFGEGQPIPRENTCDGTDQPLEMSWAGAPDGTAEFALVMDDPDARGFVHWVVTGIPADARAVGKLLPAGAVAGQNDFGRIGYGGPCPPSGQHRYRITLYALSEPLGLSGSPAASEIEQAVAGRTLATAVLNGTYTRQR